MRKLDRILFGGLAVVVIAFIMGGVLVTKASPRGDIYEYLTNFREVLHLINSSYVDDVESGRLMDGAFQGMMESLDASSVYLDPSQHARFRQGTAAGEGAGPGIIVSKRYSYSVIVAVAPEGPAAVAGLRAGDLIRAVDGRLVREMNRLEVEDALHGKAGTELQLSVIYHQRAERDDVTVVRRMVEPTAPELVALPDGTTYLRLHHLGAGAGDQAAALLRESGARSLILDLRNNPGGELDEAVKVADCFLSSGTIVTVKGQDGEGDGREANTATTCYAGRLAILVDRGTADGAEVVAAALQQNNRGSVVGEQSFGQGSVEKLIPLSNGGALLLSVAQFHMPDGTAIRKEGILPDEELEPNGEEEVGVLSGLSAEILGADRFVQRALELLQKDDREAAAVEEPAA